MQVRQRLETQAGCSLPLLPAYDRGSTVLCVYCMLAVVDCVCVGRRTCREAIDAVRATKIVACQLVQVVCNVLIADHFITPTSSRIVTAIAEPAYAPAEMITHTIHTFIA